MGRRRASGDAPSTPRWVARALDNRPTLFVARVCLTLPFWAGGLAKLFDWDAGVSEMANLGLHPAWAFNLATLVTELGGAALVLFNRMVWLGAGALGVFTVLATLLGHRFWESIGPDRTMELNRFLEHATIGAAFILATVIAARDERRTGT